MNGAFAKTLAPRPWTPGVSPGGGVAPMPPAPAPQPVFTPGVGRRPAIVVGQVEEGQAAVFGDSTGRTLKAGDALSRAALRDLFSGLDDTAPQTANQIAALLMAVVGALKTI